MSLRRTTIVPACGLLLASFAAATAQSTAADSTIIGVVVAHAATKAPIEGARLRIAGVDTTYGSDYVGEISFRRPRGSTMQLQVAMAGFTSVDTTFQVGNVDWMQIIISLSPAAPAVSAQALPATAVTAERSPAHLQAFEERRVKGRGKYITPAQLREAHDRKLVEMLERLPGLSTQAGSNGFAKLVARSGPTSFVEGGGKSYDVVVRGKAPSAQTKTDRSYDEGGIKPGYCEVAVFIDGVYIVDPDIASLRTTGFDAVEWYTASNVPPEFKRPGVQCGAVLLWSR